MNQTFGQRLRDRREELDMTQEKLAYLTGITRVGIAKIELDQTKNARADTLIALANALDCDPEWLLTGTSVKTHNGQVTSHHPIDNGPPIYQYVPEITWDRATDWLTTPYDIKESVMHPCPVKCSTKTFSLRIKNDLMAPRFEVEDLIFVDPDLQMPTNDKYILAQLPEGGEPTFKQLLLIDGQKILKTLNPDYPSDIRYLKWQKGFRVLGTVVSHVKPV
ncbi:TPA: helix-turn-helix domain-containing protein [Photobacterium damselae]